MNSVASTNLDPSQGNSQPSCSAPPRPNDQDTCLVGWNDVPPNPTTESTDLGPELPSPFASPAVVPADSVPNQVLDELTSTKLAEIDPQWSTGKLEAFLHAFFEQVASCQPSEVAVGEVIQQLHTVLKAKRGISPTKPKLRKMFDMVSAKPPSQSASSSEGLVSPETKVRERLPDAPVPLEVVVPVGWDITAQHVVRLAGEQEQEVAPAPLVVVGRLTNMADGTESWRLAWKRDGQWREHVVDRVIAANNRKVVELAAVGVPVTSNNAAMMVQYLADFEAANLAHLPQVRVSHQMGWAENKTSFLWGRKLLLADTPLDGDTDQPSPPLEPATDSLKFIVPFGTPEGALDPEDSVTSIPSEPSVLFRGADEGDNQLADGFHASGTFPEWRAVVHPACVFARVRLAMTASLCAPVLALLDLSNFGVDLCGETSKGKTTTLRIAASVWGRPDEKSPTAAMSGWNSTRVWRERASVVLNNLPVILDETKLVKNKADISGFLYEMASGRGRGRGSLAGTQRTGTWHTVMLSSGEAPATSYSEDAGTKARVLTLWGSPFEKSDEATAVLVKQVNIDLLRHYGHAGPRWVRFLLRNRLRWPRWQALYRRIQARYLKKAGNNPVVGRLADTFAVLTLTASLASHALGMPQLRQRIIGPLWDTLTTEAAEADRATEALRQAVDWAYAHSEEFYGRRSSEKGQPHGGWAGHWALDRDPQYQQGPWEFIGFLPMRLRQVLEEGGFDQEAVVRTWRDRGWLMVDPSDDKQRYHQALVGEGKRRLICVTRKAIEGLDGPANAQEVAKNPWDSSRATIPTKDQGQGHEGKAVPQ